MERLPPSFTRILKNFVEAHQQIKEVEIHGSAGGGLVKLLMSETRALSLTIDPSILKPDCKNLLEDLIVAAMNDCHDKRAQIGDEKAKKITEDLMRSREKNP